MSIDSFERERLRKMDSFTREMLGKYGDSFEREMVRRYDDSIWRSRNNYRSFDRPSWPSGITWSSRSSDMGAQEESSKQGGEVRHSERPFASRNVLDPCPEKNSSRAERSRYEFVDSSDSEEEIPEERSDVRDPEKPRPNRTSHGLCRKKDDSRAGRDGYEFVEHDGFEDIVPDTHAEHWDIPSDSGGEIPEERNRVPKNIQPDPSLDSFDVWLQADVPRKPPEARPKTPEARNINSLRNNRNVNRARQDTEGARVYEITQAIPRYKGSNILVELRIEGRPPRIPREAYEGSNEAVLSFIAENLQYSTELEDEGKRSKAENERLNAEKMHLEVDNERLEDENEKLKYNNELLTAGNQWLHAENARLRDENGRVRSERDDARKKYDFQVVLNGWVRGTEAMFHLRNRG